MKRTERAAQHGQRTAILYFGDLDALPAPTLETLLRQSIQVWLDLHLVEQIRDEEETDTLEVDALRGEVVAAFD